MIRVGEVTEDDTPYTYTYTEEGCGQRHPQFETDLQMKIKKKPENAYTKPV